METPLPVLLFWIYLYFFFCTYIGIRLTNSKFTWKPARPEWYDVISSFIVALLWFIILPVALVSSLV